MRAKTQALEYFPGLKESELPRYVLVSDFQNFELYDLDEGTSSKFLLSQLSANVESFAFILGVQKRTFRDQDPVNIEASALMGHLHDVLKASGYRGHDLERFLVRLLFCLFADDTGIFEPRDIFYTYLTERTQEDGSDLGQTLTLLFEVLNTPIGQRQRNLDDDLRQFPYVNGELFGERLRIPSFDGEMRNLLLEVCEFSWDAISPAIFGSLFQSVMSDEERRAQGAHYTTEKNILKVIQPLFLDNLCAEFLRLKERRDGGRRRALEQFHDRLSSLKFLDPACGCGNFLVIAYRELRELEINLLKELFFEQLSTGQRTIDVSTLSKMNVDQFYGIELGEFPARIAEVALWMMDHIMNNRLSLVFGDSYARIPLRATPHIHNEDALEVSWDSVIHPRDCSYIFGNPPFGGSKYQSPTQRAQVRRIAQLGGSGGTLDYVAAWFIQAGVYVRESEAAIGFVATNSITQGEQVAQLWPILFERLGLEISYAHRTFAWGSDARGMAHVHVVIIGLVNRPQEPTTKRLFSYCDVHGDPVESTHGALTAYLFDAGGIVDRHLVVEEVSQPLYRRGTAIELAATPTRFHVTVIPDAPFLVIPKVTSERRDYVPIGWLEPPIIPSDLVFVLRGATHWHFGILTSRMHMAWLRHIGGRLESRYRYSAGVYNAFPWPEASERQRLNIETLAQGVLAARLLFPDASLADLYDSDAMQPELVRAHRLLDVAVDRLYRSAVFQSDIERVEHLFGQYERLVMPTLLPVVSPTRRKSRRRRSNVS